VLISTPHHLHRAQCVAAAERGKHVMVEKPLANNLEEAEATIRACREHGVGLAVNYSFRYLPRIRKAKALVESGAVGTITGVQLLAHQYKDRGYWTGARSNSPDDWRASRDKAGGGLLIMTTCHAVDYLYFITGLKATRVYSEYGTLGSPAEVEDILGLTCRFDNGAVGTASLSSIMRGSEQVEERIWGTHGTMVLGPNGISLWSTRPVDGLRPGKLHKFEKFPDVSWTAEWVRSFAASVREGRTPEVSAREGWENLAFITAAYRSLEEKRPVELLPFDRVLGGR
jgi:predicted dehydrogenase